MSTSVASSSALSSPSSTTRSTTNGTSTGAAGGSSSRRSHTSRGTTTTNNKKKKNNTNRRVQPKQQQEQEQPQLTISPISQVQRNNKHRQQLNYENVLVKQRKNHRRSKRRHVDQNNNISDVATGTGKTMKTNPETTTIHQLPFFFGSKTSVNFSSMTMMNYATVDSHRNKLVKDVMSDPIKVLQIAVRYDESMAMSATTTSRKSFCRSTAATVSGESILMRPLTAGRIYDQKSFNAALFLLDAATSTTPTTLAPASTAPTSTTTPTIFTAVNRRNKQYQRQNQQPGTQRHHLASLDEELEAEEGRGVDELVIESSETTTVESNRDVSDDVEVDVDSAATATTPTDYEDDQVLRPTLSLTTFGTTIDFYFDDKSDTNFWFTTSNVDNDSTENDNSSSEVESSSTPLTPIILSGLLANLQRTDNTVSTTLGVDGDSPQQVLNSSELVSYTNQLRHAALQRVRLQKERRRIQRIVTPLFAIVAALFLYFFIVSSLRDVIDAYGFGRRSCMVDDIREHIDVSREGYDRACRLAAASVWEHLHGTSYWHSVGVGEGRTGGCKEKYPKMYVGGFVPPQTAPSQQLQQQLLQVTTGELGVDFACTMDTCFDVPSPIPLYTMHTQLFDPIIPLDVVQKGQRSFGSHVYRNSEINQGKRLPVQWLGETMVNKLVREALVWAMNLTVAASKSKTATRNELSHGQMRLLDVGSGLSGTLFSLLTTDFPFVFRDDFLYHGISISEPEVKRSNELLEAHGITSSPLPGSLSLASKGANRDHRIQASVRRSSFDDVLPKSFYNAMVAIESLSYSRDLNGTLHNLANGLVSSSTRDGAASVLIIIDDVVHPWADIDHVGRVANATAKHSLFPHSQWSNLLASVGFNVQLVRDLTLEYDAPYLFHSKCSSRSESQKKSTRQKMRKSWYEFTSEFFGRWTGSSDASIMSVVKDLIDNANAHIERQRAYKRSDLAYYMYVCTL